MSEYSKYTKRELIELLETQEEMVDALREENRRLVPADEITHLYHELRVHQEELEVQNQELRLMTDAIEQSRHRYATLYDYAPAAFISLDETGVIHDLNLTCAQMLRNDRSILVGKRFTTFLKEGYRQQLYQHLRETLASSRKHSVDLALDLRHLHHPVFVQLDSIAIKDDVHHKTLAWTCVSDITNRKLAENRLQASETNLVAVLENTDDAIWSVDRHYHVIKFNSQFNNLRKNFAEENRNLGLQDIPMRFSHEWKALYDRALGGEHFSVQQDYRLGDEVHCFEFRFNPIRSDSDVTGVTVFGTDITERRALEHELRDATERSQALIRSKSNFFAHVSHEIRTPLSAILSYAALIREDAGTTEVANFADVIEKNTEKVLGSVNNILALSKMDWDGFSLRRQPVDIVQIVSKQAELFSAIALDKNTDVVCHLDLGKEGMGAIEVLGDRHSIEQVLSNLLSNAVKFTNSGTIDITVSDEEERVTLRVKDSGPGISQDFIPYLFEEYKQEDANSVRGSGLGLAISKRLVELMGGQISVESDVGRGTTFTVYFLKPVAQSSEQQYQQLRADRA